MHKNTPTTFSEAMKKLYDFLDNNNKNYKLISEELFSISQNYKDIIESFVDYKRDYLFDYFDSKH